MSVRLKITAYILALAFLTPTVVKAAHAMDDHQHSICSDFNVHIHQSKLDCDIHLFHFGPFQYEYFSYSLTPLPVFRAPKIDDYREVEIQSIYYQPSSRGPPVAN